MKYTYQISFNSSDYFDLTPGTPIEFDGFWITDTKIWRENISNLKITKRSNSDIYDTLETYFEDATYFTTRIYVKVLKSGVQESLHWFGIKWGTLNKELKTYEVQPVAYDFWGQYFEAIIDVESERSFQTNNGYSYYDTTTNYPYVGDIDNQQSLYNALIHYLSVTSEWPDTDIVSSFLFNDAYEDTTAVGTYRGMPLNYVTGKENYFNECGVLTTSASVKDVIEWMKLFRVFMFFDSNDKLRLEHIKFFIDKLEDNAVDYSANLEAYDNRFSYDIVEMPTSEKISITLEANDTDADFRPLDIIYNDIRNRVDSQSYEFSSVLKTNIGIIGGDINILYGSSTASGIYIYSALKNQTYKFTNISIPTFSSNGNYISAAWSTSTVYFGSNDFFSGGTAAYTYSANMTDAFSGTYRVAIVDRSSGALISNELTVNSDVYSGTLTLTTSGTSTTDSYLRIEGAVGGIAGFITGYITLVPNAAVWRNVIPTVIGTRSGTAKSNGAFSTSNIVNDYWQDDRLSRQGTINGSDYTFDNTQYNLRRNTVKFFYDGLINPLYGFNDGTRIALIEKWTRSPETGFYEIDLIYQEDE